MFRLLFLLIYTNLFASLNDIQSFEADFIQNITDMKQHTISYSGHMVALRPSDALWSYTKPVKKEVYMNPYELTIVEDELEQVIVKKVDTNFDFFRMLSGAKKIDDTTYKASFNDIEFTIATEKNLVKSISYTDEFENSITIDFTNQKLNHKIEKSTFTPKFSLDYDIIRD
ncbi:MAG: LolA-like outer membrane lipoprotein chaperone [Sulfurimonas sp.]|jgi:outer membrane lipoprotein carrier protein|nr:LolA-like outer membrane lipoprotein chaperone [Sulfurimonadaceae bacterium]